jgi:hypothetical protein
MRDTQDFQQTECRWPYWLKTLLVILLFLGAAAVRLYRIDEAPRDFWTIRQYYNALTARALYFQDNPDIPEWRRDMAAQHRIWLAEPPILEYAVSRVYRLLGEEQFWVFRSLTVTAWLVGGFFLFLLARRMIGFEGALTAAAYYLFTPYGITASRSWQPDPLMIMGITATIFFVFHYFEGPSVSRLVVAGLVAAIATLFKPGGGVLTLLGVFGFLSLYQWGWRRALLPGPAWLFAALMLVPPAVVVMFSAWRGWYEPGTHFTTYLAPQLLVTFFFWKGWAGILLRVLTLPGWMLAMIGCAFLLPAGKPRALAWGYAAGYFFFSLICSFTTPNHDYWHLQIIPLAAIGIGALSVPIWRAVIGAGRFAGLRRTVLVALGSLFILLSLEHAPWVADQGSSIDEYSAMAREIGETVGHSTRVVMLDHDFSTPLRYYAEIGGWFWPQTKAMLYDRQTGKDRAADGSPQRNTLDLTAEERFELFYSNRKPEFFVISRLLSELDEQPGLRDFLFVKFPVLAQKGRYIVFDLRAEQEGPTN